MEHLTFTSLQTASRASIALTLGLTLSACSSDAEPQRRPEETEIPARFRAFAERFERERRALGIPGAAVAILEHGQLSFARGFGTKGINSTEPVSAKTIFRTGSMGKVITAIGAMSAVEDGLLDLDAPIRAAIPDLSLASPEAESLTLRVLMSQQSGLRDYIQLPGPAEDSGLAEFAEGAELAENVDFINPPGLFWNYSNPNFYIAGRALERSTGVSYREAIRERVFAPLHMDRSFFLASDVLADGDYSHGYGINSVSSEVTDYEDISPDSYENTWARPAGLGFSNVLDWARLMQFLMRGDPNVLSELSRHEIVSSQISTHTIYSDVHATALGLADDYGLGVGVSQGFFMDHQSEPNTYYPVPFIGHGGDISGFASTFAVFPSTGFGIVVLSNRDIERPVESIRLALESFGGLPPPSAPPAGREVDPSRLEQYAGTYRDAQGSSVMLRAERGALLVSGPLLDSTQLPYEPKLQPTSLDNFYLWVTVQGQRLPLEVTFFPDEAGQYTWFRSRLAVAQRADSERE
ncbi:MAG TPA: serine hydrolase [Polyangiaceae bacterium]|nr:serine hydrolase [Polyangiaceae bacterium]